MNQETEIRHLEASDLYVEHCCNAINIPALYSEVPGSNFGPDAGYPNSGFRDFSQSLQKEEPGACFKLGHCRFIPVPFRFITINNLILRRYEI
jgi:hypothetical protein